MVAAFERCPNDGPWGRRFYSLVLNQLKCCILRNRTGRDSMRVDTKLNHLKRGRLASVEQLKKLHIGSSPTQFKPPRGLHEPFQDSDWLPEERKVAVRAGLIAFKDQEDWRAAFKELKKVLADREHLPIGGKPKRAAAQRLKQYR